MISKTESLRQADETGGVGLRFAIRLQVTNYYSCASQVQLSPTEISEGVLTVALLGISSSYSLVILSLLIN